MLKTKLLYVFSTLLLSCFVMGCGSLSKTDESYSVLAEKEAADAEFSDVEVLPVFSADSWSVVFRPNKFECTEKGDIVRFDYLKADAFIEFEETDDDSTYDAISRVESDYELSEWVHDTFGIYDEAVSRTSVGITDFSGEKFVAFRLLNGKVMNVYISFAVDDEKTLNMLQDDIEEFVSTFTMLE